MEWWKKAVIYEIYPKSFFDSNGDGIGDLNGITSKLDYLSELGIDAIWLCPVCLSPQVDNGYDVSDYRQIDPMFGTMDSMDLLISEAKKRNIRIIMDLVLNHSSDQHPWFRDAIRSRDSEFHDYYVFRDGSPESPPNRMRACFGGSAWTYVPALKQYYFHQFADQQPDLNWDNSELRKQLYEIINFWIGKGVGGFRFDVIDQIAKEPDLEITANGPMLHAYIREMNQNTFGGKNLITVGEAWGADIQSAREFSDPSGKEFSMVFQFEHILLDQQEGKEKWDLAPLRLSDLKRVISKWQTGLFNCGWNSLFWNNHDLPRIVSRWGNDQNYREVSAKMLATLLYGLQGTPYIYQGEELAMTNIRLPIEEYKDVETLNLYHERIAEGYSEDEVMQSIYARGRDNARTPMQWSDSKNAGFSKGIPWLKVNPNYHTINAQQELADPDSVFHYYQKLIRLRKQYDVFTEGKFRLLLESHPQILAYERMSRNERLLVVCNFSDQPSDFPKELLGSSPELLISNIPGSYTTHLSPYQSFIVLNHI
ncbi:glycoside hydrolase family 13 protein [Stecheria intestinalis]|uniref:glycoside hydrolase family 13 protein n=1 Tax=Stecheria intestinalis TaxID=2606630 RepID=UPI0023F0D9A8|nr:alpha-glucosidase [Stecheria intestinalis]MDD5881311.1 alpha-glucosidase [Stecheria intestinalis]